MRIFIPTVTMLMHVSSFQIGYISKVVGRNKIVYRIVSRMVLGMVNMNT
jgi:hypothetical protein